MMSHWQQKARNKASEEKRKGKKQGVAIADYLRKLRESNGTDRKAENEPTGAKVVEGTAGKEDS